MPTLLSYTIFAGILVSAIIILAATNRPEVLDAAARAGSRLRQPTDLRHQLWRRDAMR